MVWPIWWKAMRTSMSRSRMPRRLTGTEAETGNSRHFNGPLLKTADLHLQFQRLDWQPGAGDDPREPQGAGVGSVMGAQAWAGKRLAKSLKGEQPGRP